MSGSHDITSEERGQGRASSHVRVDPGVVAPTTDGSPEPDASQPGVSQSLDSKRRTDSEAPRSSIWLTDRDQRLLAGTACVVLLLMLVHWVRVSHWGTRVVEIKHHASREAEYRLDINSAPWTDWVQLEGVGETLAQRIVADRETNGPFRSVDELVRVDGIGPLTLERLRRWLTVDSSAAVHGNGD